MRFLRQETDQSDTYMDNEVWILTHNLQSTFQFLQAFWCNNTQTEILGKFFNGDKSHKVERRRAEEVKI